MSHEEWFCLLLQSLLAMKIFISKVFSVMFTFLKGGEEITFFSYLVNPSSLDTPLYFLRTRLVMMPQPFSLFFFKVLCRQCCLYIGKEWKKHLRENGRPTFCGGPLHGSKNDEAEYAHTWCFSPTHLEHALWPFPPSRESFITWSKVPN